MEALLILCPSCGATNRVPRERVKRGVEAVCGRCKTPLPISFEPVIATDANFAGTVERSSIPVLLDLWAAWCGFRVCAAPAATHNAQQSKALKIVALSF